MNGRLAFASGMVGIVPAKVSERSMIQDLAQT
jgi:hypothetical protein